MTEPSIEKIVERIECALAEQYEAITAAELRALVASWRKRGEALEPFAKAADDYGGLPDDHIVRIELGIFVAWLRKARAVLRDKP
jgi:hypothetical protein